ncbi:serine threonine protein kinase [Stylonychia lemnae]|uniref:Serine threonine protein kinase n=1 Tax=Stylonychia lemnae TaxID=5949 RepID=A0A078APN3_STYLE|nr:serine threonine protein kinase [Stylonychia lemnae]|eukprot:CDW84114.1 serine threonine protein kinase [Stylonychia lemnae]
MNVTYQEDFDKNITKFTLQQRSIIYEFKQEDQQILKDWVKILNKYVIRIDQPSKYIITKALGKGSYANMKTEIEIHRKLNVCLNAIKLYKVYESNSQFHLMIEYQEGGTLLDQIKNQFKYAEIDIRTIIAQVLLAVDFMHKRGVIHRDLKLDNILLNTSVPGVFDVRIADFGLAAQFKPGELLFQKCGTPTYIGPEVLNGRGYNEKTDIFSVGSIMFNLVSGKYLFQGKDQATLLQLNHQCDLTHVNQYIKTISQEGQDFLLKLMAKDFSLRPSAQEALSHPWFQQDRAALLDGILINNYLCEIELKKLTLINDSLIFRLQPLPSAKRNKKKSSALISQFSANNLSSFFKQSNKFQSNSKNDDSQSQVSYYKIIQGHRNSNSNSKGSIPSRALSNYQNGYNESQMLVPKLQKRNNSNEDSNQRMQQRLLDKNKLRKSKFSRDGRSKNASRQARGDDDEPIMVNVSLASESNKSGKLQKNNHHRLRLQESVKSNSNDWNVSDIDADELFVTKRNIRDTFECLSSDSRQNQARSLKFLANKNVPQLRRILVDSLNNQSL